MLKSVNVFSKIDVDLFQKFFMKKKIFKIIFDISSEIKDTNYEVSLFIKMEDLSLADITGFDFTNEEIKSFLREARSLQARFTRKDGRPLLYLVIEGEDDKLKSSMVKVKGIEVVDQNLLDNITSVTGEYDWWTTLNQFVNTIRYFVKMKKF